MSRVYAVSDIHSPRFLALFRNAVRNAPSEKPCALILAGDVVDKGRVDMLRPVVDEIRAKWGDVAILAVFGNEEYHDVRGRLVEEYPMVRWLDDEMVFYECSELKVAFIGTQGSLDRLTRWQSKHMPWLAEEYSRRPALIADLILKAKRDADVVILVSHYALALGNLKGEDPRAWPEMYSKAMEKVVAEAKPHIAIHGHAHLGKPLTLVNGVPVYNVALPLTKSLTVISLKRGLEAFMR